MKAGVVVLNILEKLMIWILAAHYIVIVFCAPKIAQIKKERNKNRKEPHSNPENTNKVSISDTLIMLNKWLIILKIIGALFLEVCLLNLVFYFKFSFLILNFFEIERHRVPFRFYYLELLPWARRRFPQNNTDCAGRPSIPLEYKVLTVLRILGRNLYYDDAASYTRSAPGGDRLRKFFINFVAAFRQDFGDEWIKPPQTKEQILEAMKPYAINGLHGCICSVDGVRIRFWNIPSSMKVAHTGKEGYTTKVWEVVSLHNGEIIGITGPFYGKTVDTTASLYDDLLLNIRDRKVYQDVAYELFTADGEKKVMKGKLYMLFIHDEVTYCFPTFEGAWVLCDSGYHKWWCMIAPLRRRLTFRDQIFCKRLESTRKDIECVFGRLKG